MEKSKLILNKENPWTLKSDQKIYENPWIKVNHHEVLDPSGAPGVYGKVHFKNIAVAILPIDEEGNTWIVGQYRYPLKRFSWEIPEGGCPLGTDPLDTAKRELQEEAGIIADHWKQIGEADISNSVTDEVAIMYLAKGLSFTNQELESTEDIELQKIPFSELYHKVINGEIRDSLTIMTVLLYNASLP